MLKRVFIQKNQAIRFKFSREAKLGEYDTKRGRRVSTIGVRVTKHISPVAKFDGAKTARCYGSGCHYCREFKDSLNISYEAPIVLEGGEEATYAMTQVEMHKILNTVGEKFPLDRIYELGIEVRWDGTYVTSAKTKFAPRKIEVTLFSEAPVNICSLVEEKEKPVAVALNSIELAALVRIKEALSRAPALANRIAVSDVVHTLVSDAKIPVERAEEIASKYFDSKEKVICLPEQK
jgi:hypothetical protein